MKKKRRRVNNIINTDPFFITDNKIFSVFKYKYYLYFCVNNIKINLNFIMDIVLVNKRK